MNKPRRRYARARQSVKRRDVAPDRNDSAFTRLFVCETLMAGERHHDMLGGARRVVAEVRTAPAFQLLDRGGLAELAAGGEIAVLGEVYEIDGSTLAALDRELGHPRILQRSSIDLEDGTRAEAYLTPRKWCRTDDLEIEAGDWRAREEAYTTWVVRAGKHEIIGSRLQMVRALQDLATDASKLSMRQYIDRVVTNASEHLGIELSVRGETDEELADSYLKALLRAGLIQRC